MERPKNPSEASNSIDIEGLGKRKKAKEGSVGEEAKETESADVIADRYDELLRERSDIEGELNAFEIRFYDVIFHKEFVDDATFKKILDEWLMLTGEQTTLFAGLDRLGIKIFTDDLDHQEAFPEERITFGSKKIHLQNLRDLQHVGGTAAIYSPVIEIASAKPDVRSQLANIFQYAKLHPSVATLVHELVHRYHANINSDKDSVLSEAQAYFSGILSGEWNMVDIGKALTSADDISLYKFDEKKTLTALQNITELYALGKSDDEIGKLIAHATYDWDTNEFAPLADTLRRLKKKYAIDEIDAQSLTDIYRIHTENQLRRAKLILLQTMDRFFSREDLMELKRQEMRRVIATPPPFDMNGVRVTHEKFLQSVICPGDSAFPYDPSGKRTGIVFGMYPQEHSELPEFGIGLMEAEKSSVQISLAKDEAAIDEYISRLSQYAPHLRIDEKKGLLYRFGIAFSFAPHELSSRVLTALIDKKEAKEMLTELVPHWEDSVSVILAEIMDVESAYEQYGVVDDELMERKIQAYTIYMEHMRQELALFGLSFQDIGATQSLITRVGEIETSLKNIDRMRSQPRELQAAS